MEISKYYENPFGDDDDATCYAEISIEEVDMFTRSSSVAAPIPHHYRDPNLRYDDDIPADHSLEPQQVDTPLSESPNIKANIPDPHVLQEELQRANNTIHTMQSEYENKIESLRAQVLSAENARHELTVEHGKLENRTQSLSLEKELLQHTVKEKEGQNDLLKERIADLEARLRRLESREFAESALTLACTREASMPSHHRSDQWAPKPATFERNNTAKEALTNKRGPPPPQQTKPENKTKPVPSLKELEAELLRHCQTRDALVGQMLRLESLRIRTASAIKKKAATQQQLEDEEKEIGRIRLQLRSYIGNGR